MKTIQLLQEAIAIHTVLARVDKLTLSLGRDTEMDSEADIFSVKIGKASGVHGWRTLRQALEAGIGWHWF